MRIAIISYELPPETPGGIGTYVRHTSQMLAERGNQVTIFSGTKSNWSRTDDFPGLRVLRIPCGDRRLFNTAAVPAVVAEHAASRFDVVEIPDLYAEGYGLRLKLPHVPIVMRAHTPLFIPTEIDFNALSPIARFFSAGRRFLGSLRNRKGWNASLQDAKTRVSFRYSYHASSDPERVVALEADLVVSPSKRLANRLIQTWQLPLQKIRVLPYCHNAADPLLKIPPPRSVRAVGFHGSIRYFKGVHTLVSAMRLLYRRHTDKVLVLAGESGSSPIANTSWRAWRNDEMLTWCDTLTWLQPQLEPIGRQFQYLGFLRSEQLPEYFSKIDVSVFPSLFDNFPSACLEAMSAGRAIVASRSGGMEEMIEDGVSGILFEPGNARQLSGAICKLIETDGLAERLGTAARLKITTAYHPSVIAERQLAIYEEAIKVRQNASRGTTVLSPRSQTAR